MKRQIRIIFISFFLVSCGLFSANLAPSEETPSSPFSESIQAFEKFMKERMKLDNVPGISVGFLKDDYFWAQGFGYSDLENRAPAKAESSYRLASITKTITALAVLQLVEAGKIDLDADIQTYVPYFPKKRWPVTVRQLLGHLGGISHYRNYDTEQRIKVQKSTKEAIAIFKDFPLVAEPGTRYSYSSYGYNLLGAAIEAASGQSYGNYIKEHIFEPLGMKNSRMDSPVDLIPLRVKGYRLLGGKIKSSEYVDVSSRFATGGTRSTVVDLLKYAQGIVDGKLLKKETYRQMFRSMVTKTGFSTSYGMGWNVNPWRGHFQVSHGGSQSETRTYFLILPKERFALAIATNLEQLNLTPYIRRLAELVLDEDLDSRTYVSDKEGQVILDACDKVFSYGMSRYEWNEGDTAEDENDLVDSFSYFSRYVNKTSLAYSFNESKRKISSGIHPVSNNALIKVGTFMASALEEANGKGSLALYHKKGPLAFFYDYILISEKWGSEKKEFTFKKKFIELISQWKRDWQEAYPDYMERLLISTQTDFDKLLPSLSQAFEGKKIYPDLTYEILATAQHLLERDETEKAFKILNLSAELYPLSPAPLGHLAAAYIWTGDFTKARDLFKKTFAMNPSHSSVSLGTFDDLVLKLQNANKIDEIFALAEIMAELRPKHAYLHRAIGTMYYRVGRLDKAIEYYKRALSLNPKFKDVREILERLKKEKKN